MITNFYYYFEKAISKDVCNKIIDMGIKAKVKKSITLMEAHHGKTNKARESKDVGLEEQWLYDTLYPYLNEANSASGWNFDIDWSETLQFTVYDKGGYYNWHRDAGMDSFYAYKERAHKNYLGKIRKISMTLLLNDPKDFEGGDLEFDYGRNEQGGMKGALNICKEARSQGSLIFFPSFLPHRVTPVTKGTRYSLVMWSIGKPFR